MRNFQKLLTFILLLTSHAALAQTSAEIAFKERLEIQSKMRNEVLSIIREVDPHATVSVELIVPSQVVPLPATGLRPIRTIDLGATESLNLSTVKKIIVRIETGMNPVPDWLRKRIATVTSAAEIQTELEFTELSPEEITYFKPKAPEHEPSVVKVQKTLDPILPLTPPIPVNEHLGELRLYLSAFFCLAFAAIVFSMVVFRVTQKSLQKLIEEKILPLLGSSTPNLPTRAPTEVAQSFTAATSASPSDAQLKELAPKSFVALLADCYWCHQDGYARWLWQNASQDLRSQASQSKRLDRNYLRHIQSETPVHLDLHLDPYFLNPLPTEHLNQTDFMAWLQKNPKYIKLISPLRAKYLPISLKDRLALESKSRATSAPQTAATTIPDNPSPLRVIPNNLQVPDLSLEDEEFIFENPDSLDPSIRTSFKTLVWLSLTPDSYQTRILSELDAAELAACWVGPKQVLNKLASNLPEKKRGLMQSYLRRISPQKETEAYTYLVQEGLKGLDLETKKAA